MNNERMMQEANEAGGLLPNIEEHKSKTKVSRVQSATKRSAQSLRSSQNFVSADQAKGPIKAFEQTPSVHS